MKHFLLLSVLALPFGMFAQGPNTNIQANPPQQVQRQNINYYDQINNDDNNIQINVIEQQDNPPVQAQGATGGSFFGSENNQEKPCADCDEVKRAIKASHASSGSSHHKRSLGMKKWSRKFSAKTHMKMKKMFARTPKVKTSYSLCFNWH